MGAGRPESVSSSGYPVLLHGFDLLKPIGLRPCRLSAAKVLIAGGDGLAAEVGAGSGIMDDTVVTA